MKNKKIRELLKDLVDGLILGVVVIGMFVGAVKINAAGADTELPEEYQQYCEEIGQEYNICPELLMAVIERESDGDENAVGKYGEVGLMQIYPKYREDYKRACDQFIHTREDFEEELKKIPYIKVMPSQANYFFLEVLPPYKPKELCAILLKKYNILASACLAKKGIEPNRYMRIAVRNHGDNAKFIQALKELI